MAIAGRVAIVPKGEWSQSITYDKLDLVTYNGNTFIAYKPSVGVTPVDGDTWMLIMQGIDPQDIDNIINGTTPVAKAKDADTVDDYHASDLQKIATTNNATWQTFTRDQLLSNIPEYGEYKTVMYPMQWTNFEFPEGIANNLYYEIRFSRSIHELYYAKIVLTSLTTGEEWTCTKSFDNQSWTPWKKTAYADEVLPLTGGTLSGGLGVNGGLCTFYADGNHVGIMAKDVYLDDNNSRTLMLFNTQFAADDAECFQIWKRVGGAITPLTVLHTGNSNAVIKSTTAPSDTTAVWVDSANKVSKIYIDGAWTALA